ncbi:MAG TPA: DUF29 domain-containing protein [Plasticicumulans sp.]|uniref:DUF29 domain-containing protein n=1 Tax=Plasticicumulans sp. TaxID=2307179 RepID=UPI002CD65669|nr:DUF29 domain-containing protein [Plasticicumulans sp.]HMV38204.1 DUF29 domain-containing protein [Plasticicumulans sp.]HMW29804.1 DUF29 domain-containing protein [Plasticicumulans sp.]HMW41913.1 DUF29 domain-containing protein [Plasticicumulans sp.]HNB89227.1 DUF29 domain-containing protein [Plasticicumulans sp.]HND97564.1 DUF29 domain-containing protein [Plasticicumulans sp.]
MAIGCDMSGHDADFYGWTREQAAALRAGRFDTLDREALAEEIESMGNRERRELVNRLAVLLCHLLKWQYQPERRGSSWRSTIREQRRQVALILRDNPSLRPKLPELLADAYEYGAEDALEETGFFKAPWPQQCPFGMEQVLAADFWPV